MIDPWEDTSDPEAERGPMFDVWRDRWRYQGEWEEQQKELSTCDLDPWPA